MKHTNKSLKVVVGIVISLVLQLALYSNAAAQFLDNFSSPTLDPAWMVVQTWTGGATRAHGNTSPGNHFSLTDNPGFLRYSLDPMTHSDGFLNGYATTTAYHSCCTHDAGLEFHRTFAGEDWRFEAGGNFVLPNTNGRHFGIRIYFGTGGANTYYVDFRRGADVNQNYVSLHLVHKTGATLGDQTYLQSFNANGQWYYGTGNYPTAPIYFRLVRKGGVLTAYWSDNGTAWNEAWAHDLGTALNGLSQRVVVTGLSWFNTGGSYADWDYISVTSAPLQLLSSTFFGGAGDQNGTGIAVTNAIYVSGAVDANQGDGLVARYALPLTDGVLPVWNKTFPTLSGYDHFSGIGVSSEGVYLAGQSFNRTTDTVGGKENKGITVKFPLTGPPGGGFDGSTWDMQSPVPPGAFSYGGGEALNASTVAIEGGLPFVYVTGHSQSGFFNGGRLYVSKLDASGTVLWTQTDAPGDPISQGLAITTLNGNVYIAGHNDDAGNQVYLLKYAPSGGPAIWTRKSVTFNGNYYGITSFGGAIYAFGQRTGGVGGSSDFLIEKWDEAGTLQWSQQYDRGSGEDILYAGVGLGTKIYAVGSTTAASTGGKDIVLLELDPATGNLSSITLYGGTQDDIARGAATDGDSIYVVGESKSFPSAAGNVVGQNDLVLLNFASCISVSIPNNLKALRNTTLTVPVDVSNTTGRGILSFDFTLTYDPAVMTPLATPFDTAGTLSSGFTVTVNSSTPGTLIVSGFGSTELSGAGTLLNLKFNMVAPAPASSNLNFSNFSFNEGTPCATTTNGLATVINGTISGAVTYGSSATPLAVPNVTMTATGTPNVVGSTNSSGAYSLNGFGNGTYTVTPSKTGDVNNSITAFDAARVAQHVVGSATLTANQQIAADVSNNGSISSFDAALISRYVVSLPNSGITGTWKFVPANRAYANVEADQTNQDYVAILMGEVSGNWTPPSPFVERQKLIKSVGIDSIGAIGVSLSNQTVEPNSNVIIPINVQDTTGMNVISYEFDLSYDPSVLQLQATPIDMAGTLSNGMSVTVNTATTGLIKVAAFGATSMSGAGVLLKLKFTSVGSFGSVSPLTWQRFMFNENNPQSVTSNGQVTISVPTASTVSVSGQVTTANGRGIAKARVTLTGMNGTRTVTTNPFGYFLFTDVEVGETYIFSVSHKRYSFSSQVFTVMEETNNLNFVTSDFW